MPKFKPARLVPKLFTGVPFSGANYDLSTFSANTIAPYELGLDTSDESIVVNFGGHVVSFRKGCCPFSAGTNHEMWYYSGSSSAWVRRDMGIRVADNATDWFTIGATTNVAYAPVIYGGLVGGLLNSMSGTSAALILGGYSHIMSGSIAHGASAIVGGASNAMYSPRHCGIFGGSNNTINAVQRGAVIGGENNLLIADGSVIIGASGITATTAYTTYAQNVNINGLLDLAPVTVLPAPSDGRVVYSANTGLMLCVGSTWKLITAV